MFELELQEWIPYLFSISLLCTFVYAYATHLHDKSVMTYDRAAVEEVRLGELPQVIHTITAVHKWLIRYIKRKDAPDDDESECLYSFVSWKTNKRGGYSCHVFNILNSLPKHV
ncbi:hypothetical protein [Paenibacillus sp. L3-i20]|uniref:hypothetical protein n=1 Tax=Paenibacillus sp. L3-i20 TaxID=2905833 RepID=UPI001EDE79D3|nr:hypothetical protein [Paenibacillus sp. L3-i20]GKU77650.1 hypothetical protein L3i20_v220470 [Paenibacillus sp. L3-i20]